MNKIDEMLESAKAKIDRMEALSRIYEYVQNQQKWDTMHIHDADEEHDETWYTGPAENDYTYTSYKAYCEVLTAIEKLAEK